jgi:hypothetical protein
LFKNAHCTGKRREIPGELEGIEIEIEIEGGTEAIANDLRKAFNGEDEDVVFGHSFGGTDFVTIVTTLGKATIENLLQCWAKIKTNTPKTKLRIGSRSISMDGFSREDILALFESPAFQKAAAEARKK